MYDVGYCSPNVERVVFRHLDFEKIGIGGNQPTTTVTLDKTLDGVLAVELADGYFAFCRIALALVHNKYVTRMDVC